MIGYQEVLRLYLERTGFRKKDLLEESKDRRMSERRQLLWLIIRSKSPLIRYKDIVKFMDEIGYKTTISNVQQGIKMIEKKMKSDKFREYHEIYKRFLDDV